MQISQTISIIIPTHNRVHTLGRALDSVLAQTYRAYELIVVDDGSNDGTADFLATYGPRITRCHHEHRRGVSAARNTGIATAKGSWLAFLDSDDLWKPTKLEEQMAFFQREPQWFISQTEEEWIRHGVRVNAMAKHSKPHGWIFNACLPLCVVSPSAVMIHRSVFDKVGLFDESLPACEDYDLWLRIALHYPIALIPQALITKYGGHSDQLSRQYWGMDRFRVQALENILQNPTLTEAQRQAVVQELHKKLIVLIKGFRKRGKEDEALFYENKLSWLI